VKKSMEDTTKKFEEAKQKLQEADRAESTAEVLTLCWAEIHGARSEDEDWPLR
ncbi:unnamed protein product, partial [Effrenium voratum]